MTEPTLDEIDRRIAEYAESVGLRGYQRSYGGWLLVSCGEHRPVLEGAFVGCPLCGRPLSRIPLAYHGSLDLLIPVVERWRGERAPFAQVGLTFAQCRTPSPDEPHPPFDWMAYISGLSTNWHHAPTPAEALARAFAERLKGAKDDE